MLLWKSLFLGGSVLLQVPSFASSQITVAVFDSPKEHTHSRQVIELIKKNANLCSDIQFQLFPIFNSEGLFQQDLFIKHLKQLDPKTALVHISWNTEVTSQHKPLIQALNHISQLKIPLVAASGAALEFPTRSLRETVMGQVQRAILVGELDHKGKLPLLGYYGPEVLIATQAPAGTSGSSFSSTLVSAQILNEICMNKKRDWYHDFKKTKQQSQQVWPELKDYFLIQSLTPDMPQ